ncbi:MAG: hypothetical protein AAF446_06430 [Pseudomonadota bacterium]
MKNGLIIGLTLLMNLSVAACSVNHDVLPDRLNADEYQRPGYVDQLFDRVQFKQPEDLLSRDGQRHMQMLPAVGREDLHAQVEGWTNVAQACRSVDDFERDPLDRIAELASQTRVLIINEAHDRPVHRYFIQRVAERFAPLGYRYFAAEAFDPDTFSNDAGFVYPLTNGGTYVNEPAFGRLVRLFMKLDYKLFAYDRRNVETDHGLPLREQVERREERQADRLAELIERMPKDTRLLVHVDYSHAAEVPIYFFGEPLAWMAARLAQKTGLDPLTIDQTDCISGHHSISLSMPSPRHMPGQHDLVIAHPPLSFNQYRPEWRFMPGIQAVEVPEHLLSDHERTIVEARAWGEPIDAVPVDRIMLWPGESIALLLPKGVHRIDRFIEGSASVQSVRMDVGEL